MLQKILYSLAIVTYSRYDIRLTHDLIDLFDNVRRIVLLCDKERSLSV